MSKCYWNAIDRAITKHGEEKRYVTRVFTRNGLSEWSFPNAKNSRAVLQLSDPRDRSSSSHYRSNEKRKTISRISERSLWNDRRIINYSLPLSTKVPCSTHVPCSSTLERERMPYGGPSVRFVNATARNKRVKSRFHGSTRESFHETGWK